MERKYPSLGSEIPPLFQIGVGDGMLEYAAGCGLTAAEVELHQQRQQTLKAMPEEAVLELPED